MVYLGPMGAKLLGKFLGLFGRRTPYRLELFRGENGRWYWRLQHRNGNKLATSEGDGYSSYTQARDTVEEIARDADWPIETEEG